MAHLLRLTGLAPVLLLPALALAAEDEDDDQDQTAAVDQLDRDDLEYQKDEAPLQKIVERLEASVTFDLEWHEMNNLDFRRLDESGDQAIFDSDDRTGVSFLGIGIDLAYEVDETLSMTIGANHRGLWGTDQLGGTNAFGGWVYFTSAYVDWHPWGDDGVHFRLGRQPFELGGIAGTRDYIWADINDMVRVDIPLGGVGSLTLVPVDVMASTPNADDINFVGYISQSTSSPWNFRGRNRTLRHGGVFRLQREGLPVEVTAYGFFTAVGAGGARRDGTPGTGADISYAGELGNFADNDWIANGGLRAQASFGRLAAYAQLEGSTGIDRKEKVARDVDTTGAAWGAGVVLEPDEDEGGLTAQLQYFESLGAAYAEDGMQYSHGYVGMKGRHLPGLIANRYLGLHPTAYLGWSGVSNDLHQPDRIAGTRVIHARAGVVDLGPLTVLGSFLFLQDTAVSFVDLGNLDTLDPPFGYSREEFAAQERAGTVIGQELNLDVWVQTTEALSFNASGAIFLPGRYYDIEVARVVGTQLGSATGDAPPAWGMWGGAHVRF